MFISCLLLFLCLLINWYSFVCFSGKTAACYSASEGSDSGSGETVHGGSTSGGSMSTDEERATTRRAAPGNTTWAVAHYIGCTPDSTNIRLLLLRICREISERFSFKQVVPEGWLPLQRFFRLLLVKTAKASQKFNCAVLIAIDGLDELSDDYDAHNMKWFPPHTGIGVRFLITTTAGLAFNAISRRTPQLPIIALSPLSVRWCCGHFRRALCTLAPPRTRHRARATARACIVLNSSFSSASSSSSSARAGARIRCDLQLQPRDLPEGEFSFIYRYILRESCSQFDSLPLTSDSSTKLQPSDLPQDADDRSDGAPDADEA